MREDITIATALFSLRPTSPFQVEDDVITWNDTTQTQPTDAEIQAEITRLQAEYDNNQYQRDRQYPPIGDQLDMIYHAGLGGDEFQATIKAVKDAHPKP